MPSVNGSDTEIESDSGISRNKKSKNKPLMEKKRRARINRSLSQLKQILIQDEHKNTSQHSKWEKADILEMTVDYLKQLRSQNSATSSSGPPTVIPKKESPPPPTVPLLPYPVMQQYMAYQQLAQISMYSSMISGIPAIPPGIVLPPFGTQPKGRSQSGDL